MLADPPPSLSVKWNKDVIARPGPEGGAERAEDNHKGDVGTEICMGGRRPLS